MKRIIYSEQLARKIQNWGEQDPRIHDAEMKRWRKIWNAENAAKKEGKKS